MSPELLWRVHARIRAAELRAGRHLQASTRVAAELRAAIQELEFGVPAGAHTHGTGDASTVEALRASAAFEQRSRTDERRLRDLIRGAEARADEAAREAAQARAAFAEQRERSKAWERRAREAERERQRAAEARREDDPPVRRRPG